MGNTIKTAVGDLKNVVSTWLDLHLASLRFGQAVVIVISVGFAVLLVISSVRAAIDEITNFSGVHINGSFATATPAFLVNQQGLGAIAEFQDDGTTIVAINDGGTVNITGSTTNTGDLAITGALDVQGGNITLQNDETIANNVNGIIALTATTISAAGNLETTGALDVQGGDITLESDDTISNAAAGTIVLDGATAVELTGALDVQGGAITLESDDQIGNPAAGSLILTATTISAAGNLETTGALDIQGGDITLQNDETISNYVNGVVNITATTISAAGNLETTGTLDVQGGDITLESDDTISNAAAGTIVMAGATAVEMTGALDVQGGDITLQSDDTISNAAAGTIILAGATAVETTGALDVQGGDITLQSDDTISNAAAGTIILSGATAVELTGALDVQGGGITLQNDETIGNAVNGTVEVTADIILATGDLQSTDGLEVSGGWPAAAGSADVVDITETAVVQDGTDVLEGVDINLTGADNTGEGNDLTGINFGLTTPDVQGRERAIVADDADWEMAMDAGANPIVSTSQRWMEDGFGDTIHTEIVLLNGSDGGALDPALDQQQYGVILLDGGDSGASVAADTSEMALGLHWKANQGSLIFETRLHLNTDITEARVCAGLTDLITLEQPATIAGSDVVTIVADDFVAFCYDTGSDADTWFALSADSTAAGTGAGATAVAPTAGVYQVLRIEVDATGAQARFYIGGVLAKTITAGAISPDVAIGPFVTCQSLAANTQTADVDYVMVDSKR